MRYLIFAGTSYYSAGGGRDFICACGEEDEALLRAKSIIGGVGVIEEAEDEGDWNEICKIEWSHVFDAFECEIIAKFGDRPYGRSFDNDMILYVKGGA